MREREDTFDGIGMSGTARRGSAHGRARALAMLSPPGRRYVNDFEEGEGPKKPKKAGMPLDWHRLVRALLRGKWWLVVAVGIGSIAGFAIGKFVVQHTYEASASIRFEGLPGGDHMTAQRELPAMVSITHSEPIMASLRDRMELGEASLDLMRQRVQVQSDAGSGLVSFTTTGESAERAADMANALVDIFLEHHRAQRTEELQTEMASIDQRVVAANAELRESRRAYDAFREANQITDLTAEQEQGIQQAAELRSQADLAQAEILSLEARVTQLEGAVARTPRMEATSTGGGRLAELRGRLDEARGQGLSDQHPTVMALERQVASLRRSGGGGSTRMGVSSQHEQLATALAEAQTELEATRQRHVGLERLAREAHERTNRFSTIEGQAATLLAAVNVKQALVQELTERRARIEDELRDVPTGFRTVAEARPPESAVPSKRKYGVALGIPLAFVAIMGGMLLFRELKGMRVQTPMEVAWWGDGPVIGTTRWPREPRALIDLIADMDDFAPDARGTMLVVGATEGERDLSAEIARQLNHDWNSTTVIDMPVVGALPSVTLTSREREESAEIAMGDDDDPISGEIHDGPTEIVLAHSGGHDLPVLEGPTEISVGYSGAPRPMTVDPDEALVCTAWNGPSEGQALRRAARLADRVLVVVTSNGIKAPELARTKDRLGRPNGIGYVLIGVSEAVAKLPDREGPVEDFWNATAA